MTDKDHSKSRFKTLIRIDPKQVKYIRHEKLLAGYRTLAGTLDAMVNHFKKCKHK